jgi:hypothetical protein
MPVSDEEYNAALALEVWSYQMINKGKHSSDDFTLEENIEYTTLLMEYERQSGTINSLPSSTPDMIRMGRLIKLISLKNDNLLEKFCR